MSINLKIFLSKLNKSFGQKQRAGESDALADREHGRASRRDQQVPDLPQAAAEAEPPEAAVSAEARGGELGEAFARRATAARRGHKQDLQASAGRVAPRESAHLESDKELLSADKRVQLDQLQ